MLCATATNKRNGEMMMMSKLFCHLDFFQMISFFSFLYPPLKIGDLFVFMEYENPSRDAVFSGAVLT